MLVLEPIIVVVMAGSDDMISPFKLQEMVNGMSPLLILHVTCTNSPSFTASSPKSKGAITGFSANQITT